MTIGTGYDIGQELFYIKESGISSGEVTRIDITVMKKHSGELEISTFYRVYGSNVTLPSNLYPTKQDAANAWLARAGLEPGLQNV